MNNIVKLLIIALLLQTILLSQNWSPKYSVNCYLDLEIHGYSDIDKNNPWAVAESLFNKDNYKTSCYGMKIKKKWTYVNDTSSNYYGAYEVQANGVNFYFNNSMITVVQTICNPPGSTERKLVKIYFKDMNIDI